MKTYRIAETSELIDSSYSWPSASCSIELIAISDLLSFRIWLETIKQHLIERCANGRLSALAAQKAFLDLSKEQAIVAITGPAKALYYKWENREPKILLAWADKIIVQSDSFWLAKYPFLNCDYYRQGAELALCSLRGVVKPIAKRNAFDTQVFVNASHNNHFGHFSLDNLPLLQLLNGPLVSSINKQVLTGLYPYSTNINSFLDLCNISILPSDCKACCSLNAGILLTIDYDMCLEIFSTSSFVNAFIWRKAIAERMKGIELCLGSPRVALLRQGQYSTRIHNRVEIDHWLEANGFIIVEPSELDHNQLFNLLYSAKVIISETGTCTLNACMFSSDVTRIISLAPSRLILSPDLPMIHGGLPYILPFIDRTIHVLGESRMISGIQSSDICYYPVESLEEAMHSLGQN